MVFGLAEQIPHDGVQHVGQTGLVKTTHGVSLWDDPKKVEKWGVYEILSIPDELKIIQRGEPKSF